MAILRLHTQWGPVTTAVRGLNWKCWLAALLLNLFSQIASAWRWSVLARPLGFAFSRLRYLRLYFAGMFFSLCLPSSIGGDVLKAYWLAPTVAGRLLAGCSVLADRLSGVIALLVIGLTAVAARHFGLSLLGSGGVGIFLLAAALTASTFGLSVLGRVGSLLPQSGRLKGLVDQLQPYHDRPEVFRRSVGWGLSVQLLNVLVVMELGAAMGLGLPAGAYCLAVPAVALLTILPVSISGVGVREGALVWMLASYGVSQELAVTLGLLWFLVTVVSGLAGGIVYLCGVQAATAPLAPCRREAEREGWGAAQTSSPSPQPSPVEGEGAVAPLAPCGRGAGGEGWNRLVAHPSTLTPTLSRQGRGRKRPGNSRCCPTVRLSTMTAIRL